MEGKTIYQYNVERGIISIDLSGLTPGMYSIQGKNGHRPFSEKIIIVAD